MAGADGRSTTKKSEVWRAKILEHAARLFDEVGYHSATMDDLAESVGLAKPSLYYYYRSKDEILYAISSSMIDSLIERVEATASLTPSQRILESMADVIETTQRDPGRMRVLVEHTRDLGAAEQASIMERRERYRVLQVELVTAAIEAGEMRAVEPAIAQRAIFGMCNWVYHWMEPDSDLRPRDIAYAFWDIVNAGMRQPR